MEVCVKGGAMRGEISAIASKSAAHRLLICASLADGETEILCNTSSKDIEATVSCLSSLGAEINRTERGFSVKPINLRKNAVLDCNESGSTFRFLLPLAAALGAECSFTGAERLAKRPIQPLYSELSKNGAELSAEGAFPLFCNGRLRGGEYEIPGDISSQFISGLLFSLPLCEEASVLRITGKVESRPYIDMTVRALRAFGIELSFEESAIYIKGKQKYVTPKKISVEGDWSNAAFWVVLGAIGSPEGISITGLDINSLQGDKKICEIARAFGASVRCGENTLTVRRGLLSACDIDAADIPDLVPVMSVLAATAKGKTRIKNISRLRFKESDRIKTTCEMLRNLGADISADENEMIICGKERLSGGTIDSANDHRIAMSAAVCAAVCSGEVKILGAEATEKSYPAFFEDYKILGGEVTEAK